MFRPFNIARCRSYCCHYCCHDSGPAQDANHGDDGNQQRIFTFAYASCVLCGRELLPEPRQRPRRSWLLWTCVCCATYARPAWRLADSSSSHGSSPQPPFRQCRSGSWNYLYCTAELFRPKTGDRRSDPEEVGLKRLFSRGMTKKPTTTLAPNVLYLALCLLRQLATSGCSSGSDGFSLTAPCQ